MHLVALLFGGGLAVAADRATLRVGRRGVADHDTQLAESRAVHRPVLIALVALLRVNGAVLERTEATLRGLSARAVVPNDRVAALWRRLRGSAICSLALWTATLVAGALLVNVA